MYLAERKIRGEVHYVICMSFREGPHFKSRDLFDLGGNPAGYVRYPGGSAFYIDEAVEDGLFSLGVKAGAGDLEDLFWPFIRPDIRRRVAPFKARSDARSGARSGARAMDASAEAQLRAQVHDFDKRRVHYLRCAQMDQGRIGLMPAGLLHSLLGKSRDEIEQDFLRKERHLESQELKQYVYVIFDLQRFFSGSFAKKYPELLPQGEIDRCFLEEVCRLNQDAAFWAGETMEGALSPYLARYVIMYFDNDYGEGRFMADYVREFMDRHRSRRGAVQRFETVTFEDASRIFGVTKEALKTMTRRGLTRLYRRMAMKLHPDRGGDHDRFVKLTEAYEHLIRRKGS